MCSHCFPSESRGRRKSGVCVSVCVWRGEKMFVWLLPHQKCQHCYTYLFMGSLLSPVIAQRDHLQSHLHNDNNRLTWSGCESVSVIVCVLTPCVYVSISGFFLPTLIHSPLASCAALLSPAPTLISTSPSHFHSTAPGSCPTSLLHSSQPTHVPSHDLVDRPQTAGARPS